MEGLRIPAKMLTVSNLRDVWETKVSPTAVFHFVINSSSDIGSVYKKHSDQQGRGRANACNRPCADVGYPGRLDAPPFRHPPSTARPQHRPLRTTASPAKSPRVGPRARTRGIGTVPGRRPRSEAGREKRGASGGARGSCGGTSGKGGAGHLMGMRVCEHTRECGEGGFHHL
jgi:hypothetical protein